MGCLVLIFLNINPCGIASYMPRRARSVKQTTTIWPASRMDAPQMPITKLPTQIKTVSKRRADFSCKKDIVLSSNKNPNRGIITRTD